MERNSQAERFTELVRSYGEEAFHFAYRLCGNVEEAKDLVQEAFYRALRKWDQYDPAQPLEAWFCSILRNLFLDLRKRFDRRNLLSLDHCAGGDESDSSCGEFVADQEEAILDALQRREKNEMVQHALDALSHEHRAVLILCDIEGRSYEEIARIMEVPTGTVRSRVSRARRMFRARLVDKKGGALDEGSMP